MTVNKHGHHRLWLEERRQATDTNGAATGTNEVQSITLAKATSGTFRLASAARPLQPLPTTPAPATVESASKRSRH